jgi:CheY-like chemotaxis protein
MLATFKTQAFNHNISLFAKQQLTDKESEIYTDKVKIIQILNNLLSNALKFTHRGSIEFGYLLEQNELKFYVKDTGIGIKKEQQDEIFERFSQTDTSINRKYGGTGLGLSISKGFVELLGGRIWLDSELGKGSVFYFTIPYNPVMVMNKSKEKTDTESPVHTVLVAEDEEFNYLFIEELLIEKELLLIHAKNGEEAIEECKNNPDVSLVLMDIKMPIIDGHTAAKLIKKIRPRLPIIAQSAYAMEYEKEQFNDAAFDDYITKPIKMDELINKLKKYIKI